MHRTFEKFVDGTLKVVTAEAFEDENANIIVIGTHDPEDAYTLWLDYIEDTTSNFGDSEIDVSDFAGGTSMYTTWDSLFDDNDDLVLVTTSTEGFAEMNVIPVLLVNF